jgi:hypothetical protein
MEGECKPWTSRRVWPSPFKMLKPAFAGAEIVDRLDMMLMTLTEAATENVCTNTKCPHYDKKCRMR